MQSDPQSANSAAGAPLRALCIIVCLATVTFVLTACSSTPIRTQLTQEQLQERAAADDAQTADAFRAMVDRSVERARREADSSKPEPPTLHFLAISGGGDYGAFGAGFLVGWGKVANPAWKRPDFDIVTGVSTGSLLAPFAFLGTDQDCALVEEFYRNPKHDWISSRGIFFFLPHLPSFMTISGLERDIRATMNLPFVARLAAESRKGKCLAISATDLDLGRQKFWDVGAEAENAIDRGDPDKVQRIMLASSAIPGVFPPVMIDDGIYADGGVTANVLFRLDASSPESFLHRWRDTHPDAPYPRIRYWIIFNNQMKQPPKTVQARWPSIVAPSLATSIRSATLAEFRWLAAEADHINTALGTDIEIRVVAIPDDWRPPVEGAFKKEAMVSLSEIGRRMGADPASWKLLAAPADVAGSSQ